VISTSTPSGGELMHESTHYLIKPRDPNNLYILLACEKRGNNSTERLFCKYIDEFSETGVKGIDKWWVNVVNFGLKWEIRTDLLIKFNIFKHRDVVEIGVKKF
jgi:hypothetical protein